MTDFRSISFTGRFQQAAVNELNSFLAIHSQRTPTQPVDICMSSAGGDITRGFDIYNLIKSSPLDFSMYNVGNVASAAFYMFVSVPFERRFALPNTTFFFHEITSVPGPMKLSQLREEIVTITRLQATAKAILERELGWTEAFVDDLWRNDITLTAEDAIKYGIVSRVVPQYKIPTPMFHYSQM